MFGSLSAILPAIRDGARTITHKPNLLRKRSRRVEFWLRTGFRFGLAGRRPTDDLLYSARNDCAGSIRIAFRAGNQHATNAATAINPTVVAISPEAPYLKDWRRLSNSVTFSRKVAEPKVCEENGEVSVCGAKYVSVWLPLP
jgi:hypothetical protein